MANQIKAVSNHSLISKVYDFSKFKKGIDIGGGYVGLLYTILNAFPEIEGTVVDLSYLNNDVMNQIISSNLTDRFNFKECNFFENIPGQFDCYILSNILHDWDDIEAIKILQNCYDAMPQISKLLIIECT